MSTDDENPQCGKCGHMYAAHAWMAGEAHGCTGGPRTGLLKCPCQGRFQPVKEKKKRRWFTWTR